MSVKSENPPRLENARKQGYTQVMKELWDNSGFGNLELTSQNLRSSGVTEKDYGRCKSCHF